MPGQASTLCPVNGLVVTFFVRGPGQKRERERETIFFNNLPPLETGESGERAQKVGRASPPPGHPRECPGCAESERERTREAACPLLRTVRTRRRGFRAACATRPRNHGGCPTFPICLQTDLMCRFEAGRFSLGPAERRRSGMRHGGTCACVRARVCANVSLGGLRSASRGPRACTRAAKIAHP